MIAVNEVFGVTFQGEGKNIGMPCFFLRLSGCNQACVWCDTPYTWDWTGKNGKKYDLKTESHSMTPLDIINQLSDLMPVYATPHNFNLVISGGEPMLQQKNLIPLIDKLHEMGWWIEIETAGSIAPIEGFEPDQFTVSLKLQNSGNPIGLRYNPNAINAFVDNKKSVFKFVVSDIGDFDEINSLVIGHLIDEKLVYIMPEGINKDTIEIHSQKVAEMTIERGYNLTTRLQILLYGNRRGI